MNPRQICSAGSLPVAELITSMEKRGIKEIAKIPPEVSVPLASAGLLVLCAYGKARCDRM